MALRALRGAVLVAATGALAALAVAAGALAADVRAPLFDGMGAYRLDADTQSAIARRYADQGMVLAYGFNPREAARSFEAATRIDPECALCWWGLAWSLGPTINADMAPEDAATVAAAAQRAKQLGARLPPARRALVEALAARHPSADRLDEDRYAALLREAARRHPNDADLALLAAEALLNLYPYDWWRRDGKPQPWTPEIVALLDRALALAPSHPGANHYLVHLHESSAEPRRGLAAAERLENLVPGSGHLLHMPAHIYMRTGEYARASVANERSIEADRRYLAQVDAQGAYRVGYVAHNHHFLWASAAMQGRSRAAIAAAQATWPAACGSKPGDLGTATLQHYFVLPYYALVRFGRWDEILAQTPPPDVDLPYPVAIWHFARGTAYARTGRLDEARRELASLDRARRDPRIEDAKVKNINFAASLARIAHLTLRAELLIAEGRAAQAVPLLREAVAIEDGLEYDEPHLWLAPARHALGAALLAARRHADAERVYREDLRHYPENGWSLHGLERALRGQGRTADADAVRARFERAWSAADFTPTH
jgi:tetratricopeptide (TPR) repeat protein